MPEPQGFSGIERGEDRVASGIADLPEPIYYADEQPSLSEYAHLIQPMMLPERTPDYATPEAARARQAALTAARVAFRANPTAGPSTRTTVREFSPMFTASQG